MSTAEIRTAVLVSVHLIDRHNYRKVDDVDGLRNRIKAEGLHNPIRVVPTPDGRYRLKGGDHRLTAVEGLGWSEIPAYVEDPADRAEELASAMADNLTHHEAQPWEDAEGFGELVDAGWTVERIAESVGRTPGFVRNRLELLRLDPAVRPIMAARGFAWCRPLYALAPAVQATMVRLLEDAPNLGAWVGACGEAARKAAEAAQEESALFGGDFRLATEEWSVELARYLVNEGERMARAENAMTRESVLGLVDIAEHLGVVPATAHKWKVRALLPEPDLYVSKAPAWYRSTIDGWAEETGRA